MKKGLPLLVIALLLNGCSSNTSAHEASVRHTLAELQQRINKGDPGFVDIFTKDAVIVMPAAANVVGFDAIQALYTNLMKQVAMSVHFSTEEIVVAGDIAYERGTYTLRITDKNSGKVLQDTRNKHIHILKRQPDGAWKTWRMMVSSAETAK